MHAAIVDDASLQGGEVVQDGDTEHILLPGIDYLGIVDEVCIREQHEMDGRYKAELPRCGIETVHVHGMKE